MTKSDLEDAFAFQLDALGIPYMREYRFAPPRRWKFDFAWVEQKVAFEIEGGVWVNGRHNRPQGYISDCEKYNRATELDWHVYRFTDVDEAVKKAVELFGKVLEER